MKEIARLRNLERRNTLSAKQVGEKSRLIGERLLALPEYGKAKAILIYFGVNNEVETKGIIENALGAGKRVFLPVTDFEKRKILPVEIASLGELRRTKQGLLEPPPGKEAKWDAIDLIVVPGVAFDCCGNRIGTGKGFYDSFLRRTNTKIPLVGLCFEENLEELLPCESHDVRMNLILTEKQAIRCKRGGRE